MNQICFRQTDAKAQELEIQSDGGGERKGIVGTVVGMITGIVGRGVAGKVGNSGFGKDGEGSIVDFRRVGRCWQRW